MKFFSFIAAVSVISSALVQSIEIGAPAEGANISPGSTILVEIDRPDTLTGSDEVAIVIAMNSCPSGTCPDPSGDLGSVLFQGPFDPQFQNDSGSKPPHQNFSVKVPSAIGTGMAAINVVHLSLVEAGNHPLFEIKTSTVNID